MIKYRTEHDSMGPVQVPEDALWGAQTQRSLNNFPIGMKDGRERMPDEILSAFIALKEACARANRALLPDRMTSEKLDALLRACGEVRKNSFADLFPLSVYQTGSGTQTNMNVNEVLSRIAQNSLKYMILHPNDDVNMSQSSNDTFPSALHIAAVLALKELDGPLDGLVARLKILEREYPDAVKSGRTHLQDAVPVRFADEVSGWRASLERDREMLEKAKLQLRYLAIGGTAVGNGLNCPPGFDKLVCGHLTEALGTEFVPDENKFHALTSHGEIVFAHGALKALACDLMKIANDIRWMASGPKCGLREITIPANEPGSSIMPGKVNPTQCEAVTMVAVRVMGNDASIGFAASQGNFELNVFQPVVASCFMQSASLMRDVISSFTEKCVSGIKPDGEKMRSDVRKNLMSATALSPVIGYGRTAKVVNYALEKDVSLKEAVTALGFLTAVEYDEIFGNQ